MQILLENNTNFYFFSIPLGRWCWFILAYEPVHLLIFFRLYLIFAILSSPSQKFLRWIGSLPYHGWTMLVVIGGCGFQSAYLSIKQIRKVPMESWQSHSFITQLKEGHRVNLLRWMCSGFLQSEIDWVPFELNFGVLGPPYLFFFFLLLCVRERPIRVQVSSLQICSNLEKFANMFPSIKFFFSREIFMDGKWPAMFNTRQSRGRWQKVTGKSPLELKRWSKVGLKIRQGSSITFDHPILESLPSKL